MFIHKKPVFALLLATLTYSQFNQMLKATTQIIPIIDVVQPKEEEFLQNSLPQPEPIQQQEETTTTTLVIPQDETVATASTLTTKQKVLIGAGIVATAACLAGAGYLVKNKIPFLKNKKNKYDDSDKNSLPIIPSYQEQDQPNNDIPEQDIEIPNNDNEISSPSEYEDQESQCSLNSANQNESPKVSQDNLATQAQLPLESLENCVKTLEKISNKLDHIKIVDQSQFKQQLNAQKTNNNNIKQNKNIDEKAIAQKDSFIKTWWTKIRNACSKLREDKETTLQKQNTKTKTSYQTKPTKKNHKNIIKKIHNYKEWQKGIQEKKAIAQQRQQAHKIKNSIKPPVEKLESKPYTIHELAKKIGVTTNALEKACQQRSILSTQNKKINHHFNKVSAANAQTLYNELH
ncbi:MAG: hypothetical protein US69_C0006G0031 [candidate division TM6 bacterium GW2011_GWF2_38_10]|nr:MAG: hypothetical protein US69_C0006G0031 [candidate division TM6 bacterium GW2011_GWF2_38_10]